MSIISVYYCYLLILLLAFLISLRSNKSRSNESIILSLLLALTFTSELTAYVLILLKGNNLALFHFFNPIQFFLIALYFNEVIPEFKKTRIGLIIGFIGVLFGILNSVFVQQLNEFNSNYLLFESILIIAMSLQLFYSVIKRDDIETVKYKHFWVSLVFLLFWSITYTHWGLYNAFDKETFDIFPTLGILSLIINILTYSALAVIFLLSRKNKLSQ